VAGLAAVAGAGSRPLAVAAGEPAADKASGRPAARAAAVITAPMTTRGRREPV
jgi:hypothetical protein